jgi:hypothetical protein
MNLWNFDLYLEQIVVFIAKRWTEFVGEGATYLIFTEWEIVWRS